MKNFSEPLQVHLGDLGHRDRVAGGGQRTADVQVEVAGDAGGRLNVSDLTGGVEASLGENGRLRRPSNRGGRRGRLFRKSGRCWLVVRSPDVVTVVPLGLPVEH